MDSARYDNAESRLIWRHRTLQSIHLHLVRHILFSNLSFFCSSQRITYFVVNGQRWIVQYDITNDVFDDYGDVYLSETLGNADGVYSNGVSFTQINATMLFKINENGEYINIYDLSSLSYTVLGTTIPINVATSACMSSSQAPAPRLYVTGGSELKARLELQVLNLNDLQWMTSPPKMAYVRFWHSCIVVNHVLWAIAGYNTTSVEAINITNILTTNWDQIGSLSCTVNRGGVTAVNDMIFIVGGECGSWPYTSDDDVPVSIDTVHIINTVTKSIGVYEHTLPYTVETLAIVAVDGTIYGYDGSSTARNSVGFGWSTTRLDTWVTLQLLSLTLHACFRLFMSLKVVFLCRPTQSPTESPSAELSLRPTTSISVLFSFHFIFGMFLFGKLGN